MSNIFEGSICCLPAKKIIICTTLLLFLCACEKKAPEVRPSLNEKLKFNYTEYQNEFKNLFHSADSLIVEKDTSVLYFDTLSYFYSKRNFQPIFIKSFEEEDFVNSLLIVFKKAEEHGLNREFYHFRKIANEFFSSIIDTIDNPHRYEQLARSELLVSDAILKYSYHMRYGLVNPKDIFPDSYYLPIKDKTERDLFEPFKQDSIFHYLKEIQPRSERYKKLQKALKHFNIYKDIEWKKIPVPDKKFEAGGKDSSLILIWPKLITLGFLDTTQIVIKDYTVYDSALVTSLKEFQRINGLNDDGVIGKNTVEKLNTTPQEYIDKIKTNLERFRWNNYPDTSAYVIVNIPDFRLYVVENGKELFDMKVCAGRRRPANYEDRLKVYKRTKNWRNKPDDWETPNMYSEISYLVLNPTWNVPPSIMREEIATKVLEDSSYLQSRNFKVYRGGTEINLDDFEITHLYSDTIPYKIVQDPGAFNALGKIKFMFYNPFGIYLHDTPSRLPFTYSNRAVSHGCVRVEKPLQLAEFLLSNHPKWNIDYLKIEIGQKVNDRTKVAEYYQKRNALRKNSSIGKTTEVILSRKVPLYIDYYTAWVDNNGVTNFRDDVYRRDKVLMEYIFTNGQP